MTIEKSGNYVADVKSRKLFGRMHEEIVGLSQQIDNLLTAANAMRLALGAATLTLAEVEALHVQQSHDKRTNDAMLFEAQSRLSELLDAAKLNVASVGTVIIHQVPKVEGVLTQANRIATRSIVDNEPSAPLPGLNYVEGTYFRDELACSMSHVRNLIERGAIPAHDAVSNEDSGRPKFLWLKHKAAIAIQNIRKTPSPKKGVAALV